ncbi:MAG: hypothetical protein Q8Q31_03635 [Nanoarchaeota archaeon]|nr:hypothetical protein [Nanoarchaeota archaeon]
MGRGKGKSLLIFLVCILIAGFVLVFTIFYSLPLERKTVGVKFIVGEPPGFDLNTSEITFGRVPPGGGSYRKITLGNQHNFTVELKAYVSKDISSFVTIQSPIIITPYNVTTVPVNLVVPQDTAWGHYSGEILFEIRRK